MIPWIPIAECQHRRLYKIGSRNLSYGVFDAERGGFIGIREKFDDRFLFMEFHWDQGEPYGTVQPVQATEHVLPDEIQLSESLDTVCDTCETPVDFVVQDAVRHTGAWVHKGEVFCENIIPVNRANTELFHWIEEKSK